MKMETFMHQGTGLTQSYASLNGDRTTKKFIANKIDTVGAIKRPPAQMHPERERKTFQVHHISNDEGLLKVTVLEMSMKLRFHSMFYIKIQNCASLQKATTSMTTILM